MKFKLLILIVIYLFSCKKDSKTATPFAQYINHGNKIKQYRTLSYSNGVLKSISHVNFFYNGSGQLIQHTFLDSVISANGWQINSSTQNISYTSFNKITVRGPFNFIYDANQLIKYSYMTDPFSSIGIDTTKYNHQSNYVQAITISSVDGKKTYSDYYSQNLDSSTVFSDSLGVYLSRWVYVYNSTPDLSRTYNLAFYDVNYRQHELVKVTHFNYATSPFTTTTLNYSRIYDPQNYPSTESQRINGVLQSHVQYTYY